MPVANTTYSSPTTEEVTLCPNKGHATIIRPNDRLTVALAGAFDSTQAIINHVKTQPTRDPGDPTNCCKGGHKGFRTYKTDLPEITAQDIQQGMLFYRPGQSEPTSAYQVASDPYETATGFSVVDMKIHTPAPGTDQERARTMDWTIRVGTIVDEMSFVTPPTRQKTLENVE